MVFLPPGFAGHDLDRDFQILDAAGDVGIARGPPRLAVILVVHGPAVEPIAGEFIHDRIFAMAGHVEIEHPRGDRRAVDEEQHRPRRLAGLRRADPLAEHPQGNVALLGPVFAAPDLAAFGGAAWRLCGQRIGQPPATRPSPAPLMTARRASGSVEIIMVSSDVICFGVSRRRQFVATDECKSSRGCKCRKVSVRCTGRHDPDAIANGLRPAQAGLVFRLRTRAKSGQAREENREQPTDRSRTCRTDAVRIVPVPDADPDPDRRQRRILSRSAERAAARGRGAAARHGRRSRRQAGPGPPPVLPDRGRHGRVLRGDERGLRAAVRRHARRKPRRPRWPRSAPTRSRTSSSWTCTPISCATTPAS